MKKLVALFITIALFLSTCTVALAGGPLATFNVVITTEGTYLRSIETGEPICSIPSGTYMVPLGSFRDGYEIVRFFGQLGYVSRESLSSTTVYVLDVEQVYLVTGIQLLSYDWEPLVFLEEGKEVIRLQTHCGYSFVYYEGAFGAVDNRSIGISDE